MSQTNTSHTSNHDKDKAKVKENFFAQAGNLIRVNHFTEKEDPPAERCDSPRAQGNTNLAVPAALTALQE